MANIKSSIKRARQNSAIRARKAPQRSAVRTSVKTVIKAIESGNVEQARTAFVTASKMLDKAANKGLIHKNKAARHKSRLAARIKALAA